MEVGWRRSRSGKDSKAEKEIVGRRRKTASVDAQSDSRTSADGARKMIQLKRHDRKKR